MMLLKSNLESMKAGLEIKKLSRVFQEAITVAKYFGVSYIWIDSLCIIQDSVEDWNQESAQMSEVYSGSFCNIAATACSNGTESMLSRSESPTVPLEIRIAADLYKVQEEFIMRDLVEDSPLCQRAWVCQERLLSSRNIHFGSNQLLWECDHHSLCETYPTEMPQQIHDMAWTRLNPVFYNPSEQTWKKDPFEVWGAVLAMYTKGQLTHQTDKLVAVSGVARKFNNLVQDQYLAGLWRRDFPRQLCWRVDRQYDSSRQETYIAPSWSWASITGRLAGFEFELSFDSYNLAVQIAVLDAKVYPISDINPYGQISGGYVRVSTSRLAIIHVQSLAIRGQCLVRLHPGFNAEFKTERFYPDIVGEWKESGHRELYCLPLLVADDWRRCYAVLLRATEAVKGHFERFGILHFHKSEQIEMLQKSFSLFDQMAESRNIEFDMGRETERRYEITIF